MAATSPDGPPPWNVNIDVIILGEREELTDDAYSLCACGHLGDESHTRPKVVCQIFGDREERWLRSASKEGI